MSSDPSLPQQCAAPTHTAASAFSKGQAAVGTAAKHTGLPRLPSLHLVTVSFASTSPARPAAAAMSRGARASAVRSANSYGFGSDEEDEVMLSSALGAAPAPTAPATDGARPCIVAVLGGVCRRRPAAAGVQPHRLHKAGGEPAGHAGWRPAAQPAGAPNAAVLLLRARAVPAAHAAGLAAALPQGVPAARRARSQPRRPRCGDREPLCRRGARAPCNSCARRCACLHSDATATSRSAAAATAAAAAAVQYVDEDETLIRFALACRRNGQRLGLSGAAKKPRGAVRPRGR